jgi:septal ring factor EnvC (AmiA/AmiB activator)
VTILALMLALLAGGVAPARADDDLKDARDKVRRQMATVKKEVAADASALARAKAALKASQSTLATARSDLAEIEGQVADAKAADARIAAELTAAETATRAAAAAEEKAAQDVQNQQDLIGVVARAAYQQQSNLVGLAVLIGSESPRELASRLQWNTTVFDVTAADYTRLDQLDQELEQAHEVRADAEAEVAQKRKEVAANLAAVKSLAAKAEAKRAAVAWRPRPRTSWRAARSSTPSCRRPRRSSR